jgi:hypothetical protein
MNEYLALQTPPVTKPAISPGVSRVLLRACACGQHDSSGECEECKRKRQGMLQRSPANTAPISEIPPIVHEVLRSPGQPLDAQTRAFMEPRFGHDFSNLVHTDAKSNAQTMTAISVSSSKQGFSFTPFSLTSRRFQADPELVLENHAPQSLPISTLAWTNRGTTHITGGFLLLSSGERNAILRHEAAHRLHQQYSQVTNIASIEPAEQFAQAVERGESFVPLPVRGPVPPILAYPPQTHTPWNQVWLGHPGIIGEILERDIRVRIYRDYSQIGLKVVKDYQCGIHPVKGLPDLAAKMKLAAKKAADLNQRITQGARQRVTLIVITNGTTGYREFNNKGTIVLDEKDFTSKEMENTIAHETSHGIFEFHIAYQDPQKRTSDNLALQVADLFLRLGKTVQVPIPTDLFTKHLPPLKDDGSTTLKPAGHLIVFDTLWSGTGGHPWENVDEFFASAYAAFTQQSDLLKQIIEYYAKADLKVKTLGAELIELLSKVAKSENYSKLKRPSNIQAAQAEIARVHPPPDIANSPFGQIDWLTDPTKMPSPNQIFCKNP